MAKTPAKFEVVVRVVRDTEVLAESRKDFQPEWVFTPPMGKSFAELELQTDAEMKEHMASALVETIKSNVSSMVVDALIVLDSKTKRTIEEG